MKEKISVWRCKKCGKILATLGEMSPGCGVFGLDKASADRIHFKNNNRYIVCEFCGAKHALINASKPGLPGERLGHLIEENNE